jgi:hypothetical protein
MWEFAEISKSYFNNYLSQEERDEKVIENSYIMLHIYFNHRVDDDRQTIDSETFQSRTVYFDLFLTEVTQYVIRIENKDSAL